MGAEPPDDLRREAGASEDDGVDSSSMRLAKAAWRSWLSALATDSDAALAAALAYESLSADARVAWLDTLETDGPTLEVPVLALYAPLLGVESDPARRARIEAAILRDPDAADAPVAFPRAFRGVAGDGVHACVVIAPLYLDFVQVLSCRYTPGGGFVSVKHDPLRHADEIGPSCAFDGVALEPTPVRVVVEELAHAILADRRDNRAPPAALSSFAYLFGPEAES